MKRIPRTLVLGVLALAISAPSRAVDNCKATVKAKDGTILVSAKNVGASLTWGYSPIACNKTFTNEGTCITGDVASKCELGATGTPERITPPIECTLYVCDSAPSTCAAYIKECTPGLRPVDTMLTVCCLGPLGTNSDSCTASCPAGYLATGGGCNIQGGLGTERRITGSRSTSSPPRDGDRGRA